MKWASELGQRLRRTDLGRPLRERGVQGARPPAAQAVEVRMPGRVCGKPSGRLGGKSLGEGPWRDEPGVGGGVAEQQEIMELTDG